VDHLLAKNDHLVVQEYLTQPYLLDGLKFDFRVYVLITGVNPLRAFVFRDGLVRLATEPYQAPCPQNLDKARMHLTNYAINKDSPSFVFNTDEGQDGVGHKRSIRAVFDLIEAMGGTSHQLWEDIKAIIVKTLLAAVPEVSH